MHTTTFGDLLKRLRLATGMSMREFCLANKLDPGNYSRLERGIFPAPDRHETLERYALALAIRPGTNDWIEFFDVAAASRGEIPKDLCEDDALLGKLPLLFRTLRGAKVSPDKQDALIEQIRKAWSSGD